MNGNYGRKLTEEKKEGDRPLNAGHHFNWTITPDINAK
jgi:hypothetical protein